MKADKNKLAYIGAKPGTNKIVQRDSDSWFTPSTYTKMARDVMGAIDLDPFSSDVANKRVKAKRFFDTQSDAFKQVWFSDQGRVFMNPPYGRNILDDSINIFLKNWENESITQAVVLVNNATETKWFHSLIQSSSAICFPKKRIAFETDDGKHVSGNTRGQAFLYYGHRQDKFRKVFNRIGVVLLTK